MNQQITIFGLLDSMSEKCVRRITNKEAKPFIESIHYSRKMPNVTDAFGLFLDGKMIGVCTFGIPASRPLCIGLAGPENEKKVMELNRLAILPEFSGGGHNYASYLVSHALKDLPNGTFVVSYADTAWTHVGYVYQACNFIYTGLSFPRTDTYQPGGLHPRSYNKENHSELRQTRSFKHRYVYLVGDKRTRRRMLKELRYPIVDKYPKGDETRYDTNNPQKTVPITVYEPQRRNDTKEVSTNDPRRNS